MAGGTLRDNCSMKTLILMLAVVALAACRQEGPAEKAGRNIDQAGKDIARSVDNATKGKK
jgi:predicted small lipoprotein YifL